MGGRGCPDPALSDECCLDIYLRYKFLPWRKVDGVTLVLAAGWRRRDWGWLKAYCHGARILPVTPAQFSRAVARRFARRLSQDAVCGLDQRYPQLSARQVLTRGQKTILYMLVTGGGLAACLFPLSLLHGLVLLSAIGFIAGILARFVLALSARHRRIPSPAYLCREALPVYTILVPLYRETAILPRLTAALMALDYPSNRLDIKLIVEADDGPTRQMAEHFSRSAFPSGTFETVVVPASLPRTKPKACNYALRFARGEFTVIYDAEDRPDPDQLLKAVAAFRAVPETTACVQARLVIENARENLLSALFALDYGIWFSVLLPGLAHLRLPMPLGGTSNHFRTSVLQHVAAWDPFNVTEDADLGLRLSQLGYRVGMLDSATAEEAPVHMVAWLRQRTRWLKGYMQTLLVHLRAPKRLCCRAGAVAGLSLVLSIGGSVASALCNPLLWLIFTVSLLGLHHGPGEDVTRQFAILSGIGLLAANALLAGIVLSSAHWHCRARRAGYCLGMILYWQLVSVAAWRALWQLMTRPHFWEKTPHGMSRCLRHG